MSEVQLYIYDLAQGMAAQFSPLLGFQLDGIWHTAIVAYGREWFFGAGGIEQTLPGQTMLGAPLKTQALGRTQVTQAAFMAYLDTLERERFRGQRYHLLQHNCNHFSSHVARYLTGQDIPSYILELPNRVMNSPIAALLTPLIENATPRGHDIHEPPVPTPAQAPSDAEAMSDRATIRVHFPPAHYLTYPQMIEVDKLMRKLRELVTKPGNGLAETNLLSFLGLLTGQSSLEGLVWTTAKFVLTSWHKEDIFPVLDAIRWITADRPISDEVAEELLTLLHALLKPESSHTNLQLVIKILCNCFMHNNTKKAMIAHREYSISQLNAIVEEVELMPNVLQIAIGSLVLNYSIALIESPDLEASIQLVSALSSNYLPKLDNAEALYRTLVALGTLIAQDAECQGLAQALDLDQTLASLKKKDCPKLRECITECLAVLR
ncbi:hypothetical protein TCAL_09227 [Tigriopus californicus]|uniref:PPPDE domain-containing protein n=1 Tax=Tigriopus californicus TaxID=6832 RepID=A0A553PEX4_TIGCA|nr:uncharacterized protein LOC131881043 [Tigriopus californicus]TRY76231.1 hypothetical protein TCAL_09227 [Tigriopus californicus]|eukprot:TCALIF_09227-PA protein Name:"Similar to desi1 Desumoylating isopeptidase 1 (Xenopus laevis)" AED:0.35 eAED:0.35 QI:0/-1/0/1/-1/1/1/0/434